MKRVFGYGIDEPKKEHRKDKVPTKVEKEGDVKLGNAAFSVDKMTGNIVRTHDRDGISSKEKEKDIPIHPGELKCEGKRHCRSSRNAFRAATSFCKNTFLRHFREHVPHSGITTFICADKISLAFYDQQTQFNPQTAAEIFTYEKYL